MLDKRPAICENCESVIFSEFCSNCGNIPGKTSSSLTQDSDSDSDFESPHSDSEKQEQFADIVENVVAPSMFEQLNPEIFKQGQNQIGRSHNSQKLFVMFLSVLLLGLGAFSYWLFNSKQQEYISPVVLSVTDDSVELENPSDLESRAIDLEVDLSEGNFLKDNPALFAESSSLMVQAFGINHYLNRYVQGKFSEAIKEEYDLEDDDVEVYLSDSFALIYPEESTETWGFVAKVKDRDFMAEKIKIFDSKKLAAEKPGSKSSSAIDYSNIHAKLVEVEEDDQVDVYLLVSNSREHLDRMKELSEGVIPNLANAAVFAQVKKSLPPLGYILVYKDSDNNAWNEYSSWLATHFDYIGLDKVLQSIKSSIMIVYKGDSRLRIAGISGF